MYAYYDDLQSTVLELQLHDVVAEYEKLPDCEVAKFTSKAGRCVITYTKPFSSDKLRINTHMSDVRGNSIDYEQVSDFITVERLDGGRIYLCVKDMKVRIDGRKKRDIVC